LKAAFRDRNEVARTDDDNHGQNDDNSASYVPRELAEKETNLRANHSERRGAQEMLRGVRQLERTKPEQPVAQRGSDKSKKPYRQQRGRGCG
jgi:hypothetical protein